MNEEVLVEDVVDVGLVELNDSMMTQSQLLMRDTMQKRYCSVYSSSFENTDGQQSDCEGEDLTEFVNHVLTFPP